MEIYLNKTRHRPPTKDDVKESLPAHKGKSEVPFAGDYKKFHSINFFGW